MSKTQKQIIGKIGEDVACKFLERNGFEVVCRNYWKKWGEIDVIAKKGYVLHFVEVKAVTRVTLNDIFSDNVARVTSKNDYRPEDNLHPFKLERLKRVIQSYLLENRLKTGESWQFDAVIVYLNIKDRKAKVRALDNIIL